MTRDFRPDSDRQIRGVMSGQPLTGAPRNIRPVREALEEVAKLRDEYEALSVQVGELKERQRHVGRLLVDIWDSEVAQPIEAVLAGARLTEGRLAEGTNI